MNYSISKINGITSLVDVKKKSQALALLDAIIEPEWEYRYFSYTAFLISNSYLKINIRNM